MTVIETWGSAPRPAGAMLAIRDDGIVSGSVLGGCIEDDLISRAKAALQSAKTTASDKLPSLMTYGVTKDDAARFSLPCGGTLRLMHEPVGDTLWIEELLKRPTAHELVACTLTVGGFVLWVELPNGFDSRALFDAAQDHGTCFAPGDVFCASRRFRNCLRLSAGSAWTERMEMGVVRLGQLVRLQLSISRSCLMRKGLMSAVACSDRLPNAVRFHHPRQNSEQIHCSQSRCGRHVLDVMDDLHDRFGTP